MKVENSDSLSKAIERGLNLFLGAGFSTLALDESNQKLPLGKNLAIEICDAFGRQDLRGARLDQVSQIIRSVDPEGFDAFIRKRFSVTQFDKRYLALKNIKVESIFTTNVDNLVFKIFEGDTERYINDTFLRGQTFGDRSAIEYIALHGCVRHNDRAFDFTAADISMASLTNPIEFEALTTTLSRRPVLFLGYGMSDAGVIQAFGKSIMAGNGTHQNWILLHKEDAAAEEFYRSLGLNVIVGTVEEILEYFSSFSDAPRSRSTQLSEADFEHGKIPPLEQLSVRPFKEFFLGSPPSWHEVLSSRIERTSHFRSCMNELDAGKNVLLTGIPACGKSSLLMQVAASYETSAVKIFESIVTPEKARIIQNTVGNRGTLFLCIDDVSESIDALPVLLRNRNIQILAADREINVALASHRFEKRRFKMYDCTNLSKTDFPKIFASIPGEIRKGSMTLPETNDENPSSLFEFIQKNVRGKGIEERYKDILVEMNERNQELHDLFLMSCYVYSCRAPVSYDVISMFLGVGLTYEFVYKRIEQLGALLSELGSGEGEIVDLDASQDHFVPRSSVISEVVVQQSRPEDFKRVLETFHGKVPHFVIPRFETFKRYGFRNHFATKAFSDWEDGEKFWSCREVGGNLKVA